MHRRELVPALLGLAASLAAKTPAILRGRLQHGPQRRPALHTADGQSVRLEGDEDTLKVLGDVRLAGFELELTGEFTGPDRFRVGPFYLRSLLVIKQGGKYVVTYWCDVCSIRSYTPGPCVCCQQETELDLRPQESQP